MQVSYLNLIAQKLTSSEQENLVRRLKEEILSLITPLRIILFGSAARREMTVGSDLDVIVIVRDPQEVKKTFKLLSQVSRKLEWPVDFLVYDSETYARKAAGGGVCQIAEEEGFELFKVDADC